MADASTLEAENSYFATNPPPRQLAAHTARAQAFIAAHARDPAKRVVLITSGGTTVPLEKQTVRFIDNFSAGTRGATSAEHFLRAGYAVIFLHRQFSLLPFARHYSHSSEDCLLDFLSCADGADGAGLVRVRPDEARRMAAVLGRYRAAKDGGQLLILPFVTIGDYLHELRSIARLMQPLGPRGLLYLAAAVSDFFVPPERMPEHKIQSTDMADLTASSEKGPPPADDEEFDNFDASPRAPRHKRLVIDLDPVPKFLKNLVDGWAPQGMIASYKLETDPAILVLKARLSLERYQHHLVIGNLLATRKHEVVFVSPGRGDEWVRLSQHEDQGQAQAQAQAQARGEREDDGQWHEEEEIEGLIIPKVAELHGEHIARGSA
ncbi:Phosphopantothenate--cysteine ligase CAB2 [Escovopsis weberi]|uniref:Phosphopantothenate--cysteine ligase CAB2 n=1 Tax=Escovopsis weberi TaxID=150374 RepID=A0A0M8MTI3_ESCWE|nr:Phosphopantothenate--cysteine ligase CAB2 [Escovopsis weberi]